MVRKIKSHKEFYRLKKNKMKLLLAIFCLTLFSCSSISPQSVIGNAEESFKEMIRKNGKVDVEESEHYIKNEGKFILISRKKFLSNIEMSNFKNFYLIEIFDVFSKDSYSAAIKKGSKVHFFESNTKYESSYEQINFDDFKRGYGTRACLLLESENDLNKLIGTKDDSTFHFTVYITKVKNGKVSTYKAKNICNLNW